MKPGLIVLIGAVGGAALIALSVVPTAEPQTSTAVAEPPATTSGPPSTQATAEATAAATVLSGTVKEVLQVPGYTYLAISAGGETRWAAVSTTDLPAGSPVSIQVDTVLQDFRSTALNRTFETIVFGSIAGGPSGASPHGSAGPSVAETASASNPHGPAGTDTGKTAVDVANVPKADGGYRIAELFADREKLSGKSVRVRGVVTKALPGIMNRTFVHLADGSGTAAAKTDDLTITMAETPQVGDRVVIEGTVVLNRDFGAGYTYELLLEDAKVVGE